MLTLLRVQNLAVVESLEVELGPGLNVLTGESGAGKSVVLDALALLLGQRAQPSAIRTGARAADIEGIFDLEHHPALRAWLDEHGFGPVEDDLLLRRQLLAKGKSRAWINGRLATIRQLAEFGEHLAELHGQHESHALLRPARQRELYDALAGADAARQAVASAHRAVTEARAQLERLQRDDRETRQRLDFLNFQIAEIEELGLEAGEDAELRQQRDLLAHVDALQSGVSLLQRLLHESDGEIPCAGDLMGQALHELGHLVTLDSSLNPVFEQLHGAAALLQESTRELESYAARLEHDPQRLHEIESRLDAIRRLERKYGTGADGILQTLDSLRTEREAICGTEGQRDDLVRDLAIFEQKLADAADALSALRRKGAKAFARRIQEAIRSLALPGARFEAAFEAVANGIEVGGRRIAPDGAERVEFRFSANAGESLAPLADVGSGGEVSRVMLALHALAAEAESVPLLVFDEIDTGISGEAAVRLADTLEALGAHRQVLCVTHQPTIASRARRHLAVRKSERKGRTLVTVEVMDAEARRLEVARLLNGAASTKTLELATEMLMATG
ncbi:MAG: repair protein RecN [Candidatus Sumerlaeota bacterium]|nr:repair protein RecN [Candidatus Sumerlaeota bacterium]